MCVESLYFNFFLVEKDGLNLDESHGGDDRRSGNWDAVIGSIEIKRRWAYRPDNAIGFISLKVFFQSTRTGPGI